MVLEFNSGSTGKKSLQYSLVAQVSRKDYGKGSGHFVVDALGLDSNLPMGSERFFHFDDLITKDPQTAAASFNESSSSTMIVYKLQTNLVSSSHLSRSFSLLFSISRSVSISVCLSSFYYYY